MILRGLQNGELANDTRDNLPYGSPDAVEVARGLAASLLCYQRSHADDKLGPKETHSALAVLARSPTNGLPG